MLELQEHYGDTGENTELLQRLEWLESGDFQNRDYYCEDIEADCAPFGRFIAVERERESLYWHLLPQMKSMGLDSKTEICAQFLAASLDGNGWLEEDLSALAQELGVAQLVMERALAAVQSLDPAGVGARNLSECLCLQLRRQTPVNELAVRIAEENLEYLSKNQYGAIAKRQKADLQEVLAACALIRSLEPHPGSYFSAGESPGYITPDIIVVNCADRLELLPNDQSFPTLHISAYYTGLLRECDDPQVRAYLTDKFTKANWAI